VPSWAPAPGRGSSSNSQLAKRTIRERGTNWRPAVELVTDLARALGRHHIHLLHNARFLKEDLKASFSTAFVLAHVAVAVGCMAENANPALLCGMSLASPTAFEKLRSLIFGNYALDEAPITDPRDSARGAD
jgi:hypothetical protein